MVSARYIQGQQVQRVLVVDLAQGQIVEHSLLDSNNRLIARATMSKFNRPSGTVYKDGAGREIRLPHQVNLTWPQAEMNLTMNLEDIELNPTVSTAVWEMDSYPGYRVVNLDERQRN